MHPARPAAIPRPGKAIAAFTAMLVLSGCAQGGESMPRHAHAAASGNAAAVGPSDPAWFGPDVEADVRRVRAATERFKSLDDAIAAGYPRDGGRCLAHPTAGGMGYHHIHPELMDGVIEVERPEILVYERTAEGGYELTGVEYAVPLSAWGEDEPPTVMGQALRRSDGLGIWYLHVWVWRENPSGLFADWNPTVSCRAG